MKQTLELPGESFYGSLQLRSLKTKSKKFFEIREKMTE